MSSSFSSAPYFEALKEILHGRLAGIGFRHWTSFPRIFAAAHATQATNILRTWSGVLGAKFTTVVGRTSSSASSMWRQGLLLPIGVLTGQQFSKSRHDHWRQKNWPPLRKRKAELQGAYNRHLRLDREKREQLQKLEEKKRDLQLKEHLDRHLIADFKIDGIGPKRASALKA